MRIALFLATIFGCWALLRSIARLPTPVLPAPHDFRICCRQRWDLSTNTSAVHYQFLCSVFISVAYPEWLPVNGNRAVLSPGRTRRKTRLTRHHFGRSSTCRVHVWPVRVSELTPFLSS
ncbi:hypothetical protein BC567DRAFT_98050 [Phyllosticta citribraziliensis]